MALTAEQKERYAAKRREKYATDAEYREKIKAKSREDSKHRYHSDPELRERIKTRERERYATDPEFRERRKAYVRANQRKYDLRRLYGITEERYAEMYAQQQGCCAVCNEWCEVLHIDHCHATDCVRELLCGKCNKAADLLDDDTARMRALADYVDRHARTGGDLP